MKVRDDVFELEERPREVLRLIEAMSATAPETRAFDTKSCRSDRKRGLGSVSSTLNLSYTYGLNPIDPRELDISWSLQ